jgi:Ca-activated chloride channel family protein
MPAVALSAKMEFNKVAPKKKVHLMVTLKSCSYTPDKRTPIGIVAVMDVSTSMAGDKLEYAKKTLQALIKHMSSQDTLAIIEFSDQITQVLRPTVMTADAKADATKLVKKMHVVGGTNLSGAVLEGWKVAADLKSDTNRVIVFTDGQPTTGITDKGKIREFSTKPPFARASLTTMGFGTDVDKELLASMSSLGGGNYYFVDSNESCLTIFGAELGGLLSCVAQNIKVQVDATVDAKIIRLRNDFPATIMPSLAVVTVGDAYADENRHLLFEIELPETSGRNHAFRVRCEFYDVLGKKESHEEVIPHIMVLDGSSEEADKTVHEQVLIQEAAEAQQKARELAEAGDFAGAQSVVNICMMALDSVGTEVAAAYAKDLKDNVMTALENSATYAASGGDHYLHSNKAGYGKHRMSNKKLGSIMSTPVQDNTSASFEEEDKA